MAMHPARRKKLTLVLAMLIGAGLMVGLVLYAFSQNINLFFPPTDIALGKAPYKQRIRAGGVVREGSVKRAVDSLQITFVITDYAHDMSVAYEGILPDLFREGQGIVVQGKLQANGLFIADQVLAKHDENYMPAEVTAAIDKAYGVSAKTGVAEQ